MLHRAYRLTAEDDMLRSKVFSVGRGAGLPRKTNTSNPRAIGLAGSRRSASLRRAAYRPQS